MAALDDLPPDQRAVLQLVLRQGRSYDALATLLKVSREDVRTRARLGAETLTASPRGLDEEDRGEVVDYLLGQDALGRGLLDESRPARVWARALAEDLSPLAANPFPTIPAEAPKPGHEAEPAAPAAAVASPAAGAAEASATPAPSGPRRPRLPRRAPRERPEPQPTGTPEAEREATSRRGGALLLAGIALCVVALVVALLTHNGGSNNDSASTTGTPTNSALTSTTNAGSTGTGTTTTPTPTPLATVTLKSVDGSKAVGVAQLLSQGTTAGFVVAAKNITVVKGTYHGVWLSSAKAKPLFLGSVRNQDVRAGRISAVAPVPRGVRAYDRMIVTQEPITTSKKAPATPGQTVLSGSLKVTGSLG